MRHGISMDNHMFQSQTRRLLPRNSTKTHIKQSSFISFNRRRDACFPATLVHTFILKMPDGFNRRRDACFPATGFIDTIVVLYNKFQSQTRRLLPRNSPVIEMGIKGITCFNRRRDACFPATWPCRAATDDGDVLCFNRRRDACFPATQWPSQATQMEALQYVSIADATLASPQHDINGVVPHRLGEVSIADATLASPQPTSLPTMHISLESFNRRRDACFPATPASPAPGVATANCFNRRRDACFPATIIPYTTLEVRACFNRRRDACFPAT